MLDEAAKLPFSALSSSHVPAAENCHAGTFFITAITANRRLFQKPANAELFLDNLQHYRREGHYKLHAFVVMPDHIHLLLTPQGITLERAVQLIKGGFSRRLESIFPIWQRGFTDRACATATTSSPIATTSTTIPTEPASASVRKTIHTLPLIDNQPQRLEAPLIAIDRHD